MKLYLAGPMTGYDKFNFPAFDQAARHLRQVGHEVISPSELDDPAERAAALQHEGDGVKGGAGVPGALGTATWEMYLVRDLLLIVPPENVEGCCVLPKWHESSGATLEAQTLSRLGRKVYEYDPSFGLGRRLTEFEVEAKAGGYWLSRQFEATRKRPIGVGL